MDAVGDQLELLREDRARVEERLRMPWWEYAVSGVVVWLLFAVLALGPAAGGIYVAAPGMLLLAYAKRWRASRSMRSERRFGPDPERWLWAAGFVVVVLATLVLLRQAPEPWALIGAPTAMAVALVAYDRGLERRRVRGDVVRRDLEPDFDPDLADTDRLRLLGVVAAAASPIRTVAEVLRLDEATATGHLDALRRVNQVEVRERRPFLGRREPWAEITYRGRGALGRHLAALTADAS